MKFCRASAYQQVRSSYNSPCIKWAFCCSPILFYRNAPRLHAGIATISAAVRN